VWQEFGGKIYIRQDIHSLVYSFLFFYRQKIL
jgi:hypothetical protein